MDLTETEKAYLAGFIDGEGSIGILHSKYRSVYEIIIQISNTNIDIIKWLKEKLNAGGIAIQKARQPNHKDGDLFYISGTKALMFLEKIYPYLKIKKPQASLAIKYQRRKDPRRRRKLTPEEIEEREKDKIEMMRLNKRGR